MSDALNSANHHASRMQKRRNTYGQATKTINGIKMSKKVHPDDLPYDNGAGKAKGCHMTVQAEKEAGWR